MRYLLAALFCVSMTACQQGGGGSGDPKPATKKSHPTDPIAQHMKLDYFSKTANGVELSGNKEVKEISTISSKDRITCLLFEENLTFIYIVDDSDPKSLQVSFVFPGLKFDLSKDSEEFSLEFNEMENSKKLSFNNFSEVERENISVGNDQNCKVKVVRTSYFTVSITGTCNRTPVNQFVPTMFLGEVEGARLNFALQCGVNFLD